MNCIKCNKTIPEGSEFCPYCGNKVVVVPQSWKCLQCNLDVPDGTRRCPNCGSPINSPQATGTPQAKFCRKCGTKQKDGQKFCPMCGEPFLDEERKPYKKGFRKDMQDVKDKFVSKVDELTQQRKKLLSEQVQPQFNKKFRNGDWNKKKEQTASFIEEFINNPKKIRLATIVISCLFALFVLLKVGFSASIICYLLLLLMLYVAFMGIPKVEMKGLRSQYIITVFCLAIMLIIGLSGIKGNTDNSLGLFGSNSKNEGPHEVCIYNDVVIVGSNGYMRFDITESNGNCRVSDTSQGGSIATDIITIPKGKKWKFDRDESTCEGVFYSPKICHFHGADENDLNQYRKYRTDKPQSNMPIFRGGDKIVINVPLSISRNERMTLHLKVYFIETDDEFAM